MKYSEKLLKIPIRVSKISIELNSENLDQAVETSLGWVEGFARVPFEEVKGWYDSFSEHREIDEVYEKGFDITTLETHTMGDYIVNLKREKFERLLDKFYDENKDWLEYIAKSSG